ncbi:hypothetical protein BY458DRAFT_464916 [Sporodiniella umbellata]|nr:hypothetical protein BY458DRAFT_464916 [Sporodiniella umbellata]
MNSLLPAEILTYIFQYLSVKDLVRTERTCKQLQAYSLSELEKRVQKIEWAISIHLGQAKTQHVTFDTVTKKAHYSILMDPVNIKSMFDRQKSIHCSLLKQDAGQQQHNFVMTIQKGMAEGAQVQLDVHNKVCQVQAQVIRLPSAPKTQSKLDSLAPSLFHYTLQITQLSLPLSTLAA